MDSSGWLMRVKCFIDGMDASDEGHFQHKGAAKQFVLTD
jgi:hypothetical protein